MSQKNFYNQGKQGDVVTGAAIFAAGLLADFASLGVTNAQATAFGTLNTTLQGAYSEAIAPETRTSVTIEAKQIALENMRRSAIGLAKLITSVPAVTNAQLIALGLLPRTIPTPRPTTMTPPVIEVVDVDGRLVNLRVRQAEVETNSKPIGSAGAQFYSFIGASAPTDPNEYTYEGLATRGKVQIQFPNDVPSGATAWIAAAWVSQRGARGFACTPVCVTIQGGPVLAEA